MKRRDVLVGAGALPLAGLAAAPVTGTAQPITRTPISGASMQNDEDALHVPAQIVPAPKSISPQAQAYLTQAARRIQEVGNKADSNRPQKVAGDADAATVFLRAAAAGYRGKMETIALPSGAKLYRMIPDKRSAGTSKIAYFDIHGGGFVGGGGEMCQSLAKIRAMEYGVDVYSVDYRLFPDHPYPAGLDDCLAAYREVLKNYPASGLVVAGGSAGGSLAASLMLRARDEGIPLPAALLLMTPAVDLTLSGDTHVTNRYLDVSLYGGVAYLPTYAGAESPSHPYVSALFGDFSKGWPNTFLTSGTRDLLLSDTVRMHCALRSAGVSAELHVTEASPHTGFMGAGTPEENLTRSEVRRFVFSAWGIAP
jgi:epsilon-lactone hydrolase